MHQTIRYRMNIYVGRSLKHLIRLAMLVRLTPLLPIIFGTSAIADPIVHHSFWHAETSASPGMPLTLSVVGSRYSLTYAGGVFFYNGALAGTEWSPGLPFWNTQSSLPRPTGDLDRLGILSTSDIREMVTGARLARELAAQGCNDDFTVSGTVIELDLGMDSHGLVQGFPNVLPQPTVQHQISFIFRDTGLEASEFIRSILLARGFALWSVDRFMSGEIDVLEFIAEWNPYLDGNIQPPTPEELEYMLRDTRAKMEFEGNLLFFKTKITLDMSLKSLSIILRVAGAEIAPILQFVADKVRGVVEHMMSGNHGSSSTGPSYGENVGAIILHQRHHD